MSRVIYRRVPSHRFHQPDLSEYMLELPKSHPQLGSWIFVAVAAGTVLALVLFAILNLIF
jgi:hypothetical protein